MIAELVLGVASIVVFYLLCLAASLFMKEDTAYERQWTPGIGTKITVAVSWTLMFVLPLLGLWSL